MRSQEQWRKIIEDQQSSGLAIIDYCKKHQLSTTSFYGIRKKLGLSSTSFVRAKITKQVEVVEERQLIMLTVGKANVSLPTSTSATYLCQLLREFI